MSRDSKTPSLIGPFLVEGATANKWFHIEVKLAALGDERGIVISARLPPRWRKSGAKERGRLSCSKGERNPKEGRSMELTTRCYR